MEGVRRRVAGTRDRRLRRMTRHSAPAGTRERQAPLPFAEARALLLGAVDALPAEEVPLAEAWGRAVAAEVISPIDSPPFANSAMDGYACRAADLGEKGAALKVLGTVAAGVVPAAPVGPGEAWRIMTGAPMPPGADVVVPVEESEATAEDRVRLTRGLAAGAYVRPQGEDFRAGSLLLATGAALDAAAVGLLASIGMARVAVGRRPRVAVVTTGDELLPVDAPLAPGKIRDSNAWAIAAAVAAAGGVPTVVPRVPDDPDALRAALAPLPASHDLILSSGGVSVGDFDHVNRVVDALGLEPLFYKVNIKPGKPVRCGRLGQALFVGLPGNPTSGLVVFEALVRPALRKLAGHRHLFRPEVFATLTSDYHKHDARLHFVRVRAKLTADGYEAEPIEHQSSADLAVMSQADALMLVPANVLGLAAGERVTLQLIRQPEDH